MKNTSYFGGLMKGIKFRIIGETLLGYTKLFSRNILTSLNFLSLTHLGCSPVESIMFILYGDDNKFLSIFRTNLIEDLKQTKR